MDDPDKQISVLCLGPKGSGKTTLLKKLQESEGIDNTFSPVPTVGTNIYDISYLNKQGKKQMLTVREIGGEMASLWRNYLDGIEKVIYVVDTSNLCQISAAAVLLYTLLAEPRLKNARFILVLSKMDAAYRQMRNEALLMLQWSRLCAELPRAPALLEAAPLLGDGVDALRTCLAENRPGGVIYVVDTSNLCQISAAAVLLYTLLAEPRLKNARFILVLSKMDAAYRQMRNEALLMLQWSRLCAELPRAPALLEAAPLLGDGVDALRTCLAENRPGGVFKPPA